MHIVFFGTPEFAVPSLNALASEHRVLAVFTQPDRPKGRGNQVAESPVKMEATALSIPVYQPERLRKPPNLELLQSLFADLMVIVGYGQIIPQNIIDLPQHGILNVHASLLPQYRGAAPIQWAIANGETKTGVTIMQIDAGLDTGDMLLARLVAIEPDETAPELSGRLALTGADLLLETIRQIEAGTVHRRKQNDADATLAPILKKEDGQIDWVRPASEIYNRLRGFTPWPGAYTKFRSAKLLILRGRPAEWDGSARALAPGMLASENRRLFAGCGAGTRFEIMELQLPGKSRMSAEAFLNGYGPVADQMLGEQI